MYICCTCKRELCCDKNSVGADYGHGHVYPADRFKCPSCGLLILATNLKADFDPQLNHQDEYLTMEGGPTIPCTTQNSH